MTVRIVTWNVNGIRNPFKYAPWNEDRTLQSMFDLLAADIVCFQEVKTPKASLTDDLVFVDGWDTFYSFPHSNTGYSGVAVYTRDSKCVPLRVEEGVTGTLRIPGTQTRYVDAPAASQIGGYPTDRQLWRAAVGRDVIDAEGRCLILEFPLFVLINVYCPARRNHERTGYRNTFLLALNARIRNLAAAGKNVVLCGDLNIMRDQLDTAGLWGHQGQKLVADALEFDENYMTMRAPKLLNQLLFNSRTLSDTGVPFVDEATETRRPPVLYDTGRELHPQRTGMFTCWDTRKNHRPANFGSRIDLIMCSPKIMQLVSAAEIQPHLLGSDHCPVYAELQETIAGGDDDGDKADLHMLDYLNPPGRFVGGQNVSSSEQDTTLLKRRFPQSARRMPQFANRRHIASMFQRASKPSPSDSKTATKTESGTAAADKTPERTPELPSILKADIVDLVESDSEDGADGMIEDDDESGIAEEDERPEPDTVPTTGAEPAASKTSQPADLPVEPSLKVWNQDGEGSADYGSLQPATPITAPMNLPVERETTPAAETLPDPKPRPGQMQSFWGDPPGVGEATTDTAAPAWPPSTPTPKPLSLSPTSRRSVARSQSGAGSSTASQTVTAASPASARPAKKAKTAASATSSSSGIQMSMNMFLTSRPAKNAQPPKPAPEKRQATDKDLSAATAEKDVASSTAPTTTADDANDANDADMWMTAEEVDAAFKNLDAAKASWSRLGLGQRQAPLCEHGEPCKTFVTKKAGVNSGRSFYMCARPPGPLGKKEKGTAWQCTTFVWCRDWRPDRSE